MQDTRFFDEDGEMQKHIEIFQDIEGKSATQQMDERLKELSAEGHILAERRQLTQAEHKVLKRKYKNFSRRDRKQAIKSKTLA